MKEGSKIPMFVVDWEMAHLGVPSIDVGQMVAEMYLLWFCHQHEAGRWMMLGFCRGYGTVSEDHALRTAIHIGVHLLAMGTIDKTLRSAEQIEKVARLGREMVLNGYHKRQGRIEESDFSCLFNKG
jgi:hypothetical protein